MLSLTESFWYRWEKQTLLVATKQTELSKTSLTETVRPEVATSALVPILQQHSGGCQMHLAEEHTENY